MDYWNARILSQPDLARFALDMLAIPVSSSECERVFSSAKLLITASRNRLHPDIIEANKCLKAWFRRPDKSNSQDDNDWGSGDKSSEYSSEVEDSESSEEDNESDDEESDN